MRHKPKWWQIYSIGMLEVAILLAIGLTPLRGVSLRAIQVAVIVIMAVLMEWWLRSNAAALIRDGRDQAPRTTLRPDQSYPFWTDPGEQRQMEDPGRAEGSGLGAPDHNTWYTVGE